MKKLLSFIVLFAVMACMCSCSLKLDLDTESSLADASVETSESVDSNDDTGTGEDASEESAACTPLLYRVSGSKGGTVYLLGSIHVGDDRMKQMPEYVMNAYNESDFIAVEADIVAFEKDLAAQLKYTKTLLCDSGKTIEDHLGKELFEKTKGFLEDNNVYMSPYKMYGPAMWQSLVDNVVVDKTGLSSVNGADRMFINMANKEDKPVREVESIGFQYELLKSFSDDIYRLLIESAVDNADEAAEETKEMYEIWLRGDEAEVTEMLAEDLSELTEEEVKLYKQYMKAMLTDRNVGMANKIEQYMAEGGTCFVVVGAAHVVGEGALVQLLRDRGYNVAVAVA